MSNVYAHSKYKFEYEFFNSFHLSIFWLGKYLHRHVMLYTAAIHCLWDVRECVTSRQQHHSVLLKLTRLQAVNCLHDTENINELCTQSEMAFIEILLIKYENKLSKIIIMNEINSVAVIKLLFCLLFFRSFYPSTDFITYCYYFHYLLIDLGCC